MENDWTFQQFVKRNPTSVGFDYLNLVYQAKEIPEDFVLWFSRLFRPEFMLRDGLLFVAQLFDSKRCQQLKEQGETDASVQFWMNLLELTSLFPGLGRNVADELARSLAKSWNQKIVDEGLPRTELARAIEGEKGEVFVVIGRLEKKRAVHPS